MQTKPHPSCELPQILTPPDLTNFIKDLATKAVLPGAPGSVKAIATAQRLNTVVTNALATIDVHTERVAKLAKFSCPLPNVPNKDAGILP